MSRYDVTDSAGSYEFDSFKNRSDELGRLSEQANHFVDLERRLLSEIGAAQAQRILEIGCGPGFVTRLLASIAPQSEIIAVDRSPDLLQQLQQHVRNEAQGAIFPIQGTGEKLPLQDEWAQFTYARFLMQHVPQPLTIAMEAQRTLADGGTFCIADSDAGLIIQHPQHARITQLLSDASHSQREIGGDRHIGRKLPQILHEAGFVGIRARVINITSSDAPIAMLLNMALGYKAELTGRREDLAALVAELSDLAAKGEYFFSTGVVIATGKKATG